MTFAVMGWRRRIEEMSVMYVRASDESLDELIKAFRNVDPIFSPHEFELYLIANEVKRYRATGLTPEEVTAGKLDFTMALLRLCKQRQKAKAERKVNSLTFAALTIWLFIHLKSSAQSMITLNY